MAASGEKHVAGERAGLRGRKWENLRWIPRGGDIQLEECQKDIVEGQKAKVLATQSFLTLCDPLDCSLPGSSVHRILQTRRLEWFAIPFSRGSSQPRGRTQVSCTAGRFLTI